MKIYIYEKVRKREINNNERKKETKYRQETLLVFNVLHYYWLIIFAALYSFPCTLSS